MAENFIQNESKPKLSLLRSELATRETASFIREFYETLPNPDPILRKAGIYIQTLREIRRYPRVSSAIRSRKSGFFKRNTQVLANDASPQTVTFIEDCLKKINMRTVISEILDYFGFGYQVSEIVWQQDGQDIVPVKIQAKPQEWFKFNSQNHLLFCPELGLPTVVDNYKFLLTQNEADYLNPYGVGAYSDCFWPVTFIKGGIKFWARFIEKFGMPHIVGKTPRSTEDAERNKFLADLVVAIQNSATVISDDKAVEFHESERSSSTEAYKEFTAYHNAEIAIAILGHEGTLTATPGKLGSSADAMQARDDLIDSDCIAVAATINMLIRWILELNPHHASGGIPTYDIYEDEFVDKTLAERDEILSRTGIKFKSPYYQNAYNLSEDDFEIATQSPQSATFAATPTSPVRAISPVRAGFKPAPTAPQQIIAKAESEISHDEIIDTVRNMAEKAGSLEEFQATLLDSYKDFSESKTAAHIQQALTTADLAGRLDIANLVRAGFKPAPSTEAPNA
jgi:phage gp29-like protein